MAHSTEQRSVEAGIGIHVPLAEDERAVYDSGLGAFAAYTTRISKDGRSRIAFTAGWLHASGEEIPPDPTFEVEDARYDLLQLGIGVRQNLVSDPEIRTAFWAGAGVLNTISWWRDPLGSRESAHAIGFYLELSPQMPVGDRWRVWVRTSLQVMTEVEFDDFAPLNLDASTLDAGVSYAWF